MEIPPDLVRRLKRLRLGGLLPTLPDRATHARQAKLSPLELLELLLQDEIDRRNSQGLQQRLAVAGFEEEVPPEAITWDSPVSLRSPWGKPFGKRQYRHPQTAGNDEPQRSGALLRMDLLWGLGVLVMGGAILGLVMLATRPPRCRERGALATHVEEYELPESPRVLAVAYRCPRCRESVARRPVGVRVVSGRQNVHGPALPALAALGTVLAVLCCEEARAPASRTPGGHQAAERAWLRAIARAVAVAVATTVP